MLELGVNMAKEIIEVILKFLTAENASTVLTFVKDFLADLVATL